MNEHSKNAGWPAKSWYLLVFLGGGDNGFWGSWVLKSVIQSLWREAHLAPFLGNFRLQGPFLR
jgi:hypothetical protein